MIHTDEEIALTKKQLRPALDYIENYWKALIKNVPDKSYTLIPLPHSYVVPGPGNDNFAFNEQYCWDSFFISLGVDNEPLVSGMLDNLLFLFKGCGLIPNANRY